MKRKVCIVTGSRAEYGVLRPLIKEIKEDHGLKLQLVVTGTHLSKEFGLTYKEINQDGFKIDQKVNIYLNSDSSFGITKSMADELVGISKVYLKLKPDIIVVLGDRFEIFSAAVAAVVVGIPIAHINGGEVTKGAIDDVFRHSITKMSSFHFVSTNEYKKRVIQLGENRKRVFNVGSLSIDSIKKLKLLSKKELKKILGFKFKSRNLLVTYHPVTLEKNTAGKQFKYLLSVLDSLKDTQLIFTKANADTGGKKINCLIDKYTAKNPDKAISFASLGHLRYLSMMKVVNGVIGNSSSGIIEAPSFKVATINIGDRQEGRLRTKSIIDCKPTKKEISRAIAKIYTKEFQKKLKRVRSPYGDGNAATRIKKVLKTSRLKGILKKGFYDIGFK